MNSKIQVTDMLWEEIGISDTIVTARRYTDSYYYVIHKSNDYICIEKFNKAIGHYISKLVITIENTTDIIIYNPGSTKKFTLANPNIFKLINKEIDKFII